MGVFRGSICASDVCASENHLRKIQIVSSEKIIYDVVVVLLSSAYRELLEQVERASIFFLFQNSRGKISGEMN